MSIPFLLFRTGNTAACDVVDDLGNLVLDDLGNQVQAPCAAVTLGRGIPFFLFRTGSGTGTTPPPPGLGRGIPFFLFRTGDGTVTTATTPTQVVGWPGRLRHTRKELENRIKAQRANTFGRKWFEEFLDAQEAALAKAGKAKSEKQREALVEAVAATQQVDTEAEATALSALLAAAVNASRVTASIKRADEVVRLAARRELDDEDDDEEAMMLLLH